MLRRASCTPPVNITTVQTQEAEYSQKIEWNPRKDRNGAFRPAAEAGLKWCGGWDSNPHALADKAF
jgi:hypothetical protein